MTHIYTAYRRKALEVRTQTESQGMKKVYHVMGNQKKAGEAKLTSEKIGFKSRTILREMKDIT